MTTRLAVRFSMAAWLALGLMGCGEGFPPVDQTDGTRSAVVSGSPTMQHPEVGKFNANCTATLIGPRAFLTAARCIAVETNPTAGFTVTNFQKRGGTARFVTNTGCTSLANCPSGFVCDATMGVCAQDFQAERIFPQGVHVGADDLAVGRLTAAVPPSLAAPAQIATVLPPVGSTLTLVGYGCSQRSFSDFGVKRSLTFVSNAQGSFNYCAGDFGGPTFVGTLASNSIGLVASGLSSGTLPDFSADPITFRQQILSMVSALESPNISYRGQLQGIGFQAAVSQGAVAGIPGQNRRLEALQIWSPLAITVRPCYQAHVENQGWQGQRCDGDVIGTVGQGLRMEALQITLPQRGGFTRIRYRANVEGIWQDFVTSDSTCTAANASTACSTGLCFNGRCAAGTTGVGKKMEGVQIFLE